MPCPSTTPCPSQQVSPLIDYHVAHPRLSTRVYRPTTRAELVSAVRQIEAAGQRARPLGSDMSLSPVGVSDSAHISTDALNRHVLRPFNAGGTPWPAQRFRYPASSTGVGSMLTAAARSRDPRLVHVEAGIKLRQLLADMAAVPPPGLAIPAMGAGGRQSLVGSLATGTHGSEWDRQPLIDQIRAVHLVGPGGQEWWLERTNGFSTPELLRATVPEWCPDTRIEYDDRLLYAALVGAGRLGVIYSVVLEVEADYWLEERRREEPFSAVRAALASSINAQHAGPASIFSARGSKEAWPNDNAVSVLSFLQVVVQPNDLEKCWIVERRRLKSPGVPVGGRAESDPISMFCRPSDSHLGNALKIGLAAATGADTLSADTIGELVSSVLQKRPELVSPINTMLMAADHAAPRDYRVGRSFAIIDQVDYSAPIGCYQGDSAEYFFDAGSTDFLTYIDEISALAKSLGGVPGYISMRFIRHSDAWLAMERFPLTAAIEVSLLRPWPTGTAYQTGAQERALLHGGLPHWGQHVFGTLASAQLYGHALDCFHYAVARMESGAPRTFSSQFSRQHGLDPAASVADLDRRTTSARISLRELQNRAQASLHLAAADRSVQALAGRFAASQRMNPQTADLPLGRCRSSDRGVSLRDLSRRFPAPSD